MRLSICAYRHNLDIFGWYIAPKPGLMTLVNVPPNFLSLKSKPSYELSRPLSPAPLLPCSSAPLLPCSAAPLLL
ncbi:MAG: hypothetical protein LBF22_14150 [Deltaproteobacteria bacterium]|nr:hypothetical protein [Deltaproteobacteria bacterium]